MQHTIEVKSWNVLESFVRRSKPTYKWKRCEENEVQNTKSKRWELLEGEHQRKSANDVQQQHKTVDWKRKKFVDHSFRIPIKLPFETLNCLSSLLFWSMHIESCCFRLGIYRIKTMRITIGLNLRIPFRNKRKLTHPKIIKLSDDFLKVCMNIDVNVLIEARLKATLLWQRWPIVSSCWKQ